MSHRSRSHKVTRVVSLYKMSQIFWNTYALGVPETLEHQTLVPTNCLFPST